MVKKENSCANESKSSKTWYSYRLREYEIKKKERKKENIRRIDRWLRKQKIFDVASSAAIWLSNHLVRRIYMYLMLKKNKMK